MEHSVFPVFKLKNQIKHYAWGSPEWIPALIREKNPENKPCAELWMGIHPQGISEAVLPNKNETIGLDDLFAQEPAFLGYDLPVLPFLFKLLAADKPLSIQAHPSLEQAKAGFERENNAGIALSAPDRNYKDPNHKPEIICALTPFRAMAGFREPVEIRNLLQLFGCFGLSGLDDLRDSLDAGLETFLRTLFDLSESARQEISDYILAQKRSLIEKFPKFAALWETTASFAGQYYKDAAILSPLYLNLIDLAVGEAIFLPSGVLHAYIHGFGVELMANSDNVLRGGLTSKHIDLPELLRILKFSPFKPEILHPNPLKYPTNCEEFALSVLKKTEDFPENSPSIVIVTQGEVLITGKENEKILLKRGESAFVGAGNAGKLALSGNFTLYIAGAAPR
jgi:mannose-6-phosphate isomerase